MRYSGSLPIPEAAPTNMTDMEGRRLFRLSKDYLYQGRVKYIYDGISIPAKSYRLFKAPFGMLADGTSMPWGLWWYIDPQDERYWPASWPHDHQYAVQEVSRRQADKLFLDRLKLCAPPKLIKGANFRSKLKRNIEIWRWNRRCEIMYRMVRIFGGKFWKRGKRNLYTGKLIK